MKLHLTHLPIFTLLFNSLEVLGGYDYSITSPVAGTLWDASQGGTAKVTWLYPPKSGPNPSTVDLHLMSGDPNNGDELCVLAAGVPPTSGIVSFNVPDVADGTNYFIKIGNTGLNDFKYSHYFTIQGGKGTVKPVPASASSSNSKANSNSNSSPNSNSNSNSGPNSNSNPSTKATSSSSGQLGVHSLNSLTSTIMIVGFAALGYSFF